MMMMKRRRTGVAFIGCGQVAGLHAHALQQAGVEGYLVGVWSGVPADEGRALEQEVVSASGERFRVGDRARELGFDRVFASLEELLQEESVELVYVLTPLDSHVALARKCLEAGKHVLVEKPVSKSAREIRSLARFAARKRLVCVPGHNYVYDDGVRRLQNRIQVGQLGKVVQIAIFYNIAHDHEFVQSRTPGVVREIMTHHAYLCLFLLNKRESGMNDAKVLPTRVSMLTSSSVPGADKCETACALFEFCNGTIGLLQASFANDDHSAEPWSFYIKVLGTEGSARYSYNDCVVNKPAGLHSHTYTTYVSSMESQTQCLINECVRQNAAPLSSLEDAAVAAEILDACEQSNRENRHVSLERHNAHL